MSSSEVEQLRQQLQRLEIRVGQLEEQVGPFEIVQTPEGQGYPLQAPAATSGAAPASSRPGSGIASASGSVEPADRAGRELLAREVGQFVRRCLDGQPRGSSGRDRLRLANRYYLVFADFEGVPLQEPLFTSVFADVKNLCKRGADCGQAVFVGLPSIWECKIVVSAAGFSLPRSLSNA